jgi:hypothetical protein
MELFYPEDGESNILGSISNYIPVYIASTSQKNANLKTVPFSKIEGLVSVVTM